MCDYLVQLKPKTKNGWSIKYICQKCSLIEADDMTTFKEMLLPHINGTIVCQAKNYVLKSVAKLFLIGVFFF